MNKKGWLSQAGDTIIFDMDGTLIDSVGVWNDVDAALIKELRGPEEDPSFTQRRRDELLTRFLLRRAGKDLPFRQIRQGHHEAPL